MEQSADMAADQERVLARLRANVAATTPGSPRHQLASQILAHYEAKFRDAARSRRT
jgi:hypothetical protein